MNERRVVDRSDRRRVSRGGRRTTDRPGRYPRILVADSNDSARRPCVRYLTLFGFEVDEASTGDEAMRAVHAARPQLAIADTALRGAGMATAAATEWHIPLIVTTTDPARPSVPGPAAVLVKPFHLSTMLDQVRRVLRLFERAADGVLGT